MGEVAVSDLEDFSGGKAVVARSQKGHAIYGFDGRREDRPIFGFHPKSGVPVCASPRQGGKGRCRRIARQPNGRCKSHGGVALRGPASLNYKKGEYSIYTPPPSLLADYDRLANQPELVQHLASIGLIATLINDTLSEYDAGGGRDAWKAVEAAHRKFTIAKRSGDRVKLAEGVAELELAVEHGVGRQSRRDEIKGLVDQHRKLVDSEIKRYQLEAETYSVEQMTASMQAVGVIAGRFVPEHLKEQFFQEYTEYLGARLYHRHPDAAGAEGASPGFATEEIEDAEIVGEEPGGFGDPVEGGRAG